MCWCEIVIEYYGLSETNLIFQHLTKNPKCLFSYRVFSIIKKPKEDIE